MTYHYSFDYGDGVQAIADLMQEHYDEIATRPDLMKLDPDWGKLDIMNAAGKVVLISAWHGGTPAGYSLNLIDTHLHYRGLTAMQNDLLFVAASHRNSSLGLQLLKRTKTEAKARGASAMLWHAKPDTSLAKILQRRSRVQDIIFLDEL